MPYFSADDIAVDNVVMLPYQKQRITESNELIKSGAVYTDGVLDASAASENTNSVNVPFINPLEGDYQVLQERNTDMPVHGLNMGNQIGLISVLENAWGSHLLPNLLTKPDIMLEIANMTGDYWSSRISERAFNTMKGIFASGSMSTNVLKTTEPFSGLAVINARSKLKSRGKELNTLLVNSATAALIDIEQYKNNMNRTNEINGVRTYLGFNVVEDDSVEDNVAYLLKPRALAYGNATASLGKWATQIDTNPLQSKEALVSRQKIILHPNGVSWTGPIDRSFATAAMLEDGNNWGRVYNPGNVGIVKIEFNASEVSTPDV